MKFRTQPAWRAGNISFFLNRLFSRQHPTDRSTKSVYLAANASNLNVSANETNRVHTQFWADLNNRVNITKIENDVWAKMCAGASQGTRSVTLEGSPGAHYLRRAPSAAGVGTRATAAFDSDSARPSSKDSSRHDVASFSKEVAAAEDDASKHNSTPEDETTESAPSSKALAGILGYDELGHVPTLEEFRSEWSKIRAQSDPAPPNSPGEGGVAGGSKVSAWKYQGHVEGQPQQQTQGSVVAELAKKDEVFRHFKRYYDKTDHNQGRVGDSLFSAGVTSTGLLQPDFEVIEAVGRHTAEVQELRSHSRVGEGILSTPGDGPAGASRRGDRGRQLSRQSSEGTVGGNDGDGLTNVFRESMPKNEGVTRKPNHDSANNLLQRSKAGKDRTDTESRGARGKNNILESISSGSLTSISVPSRGGGRVQSPQGNRSRGGEDIGRAKASLEGSSTSAELQVRMCTAALNGTQPCSKGEIRAWIGIKPQTRVSLFRTRNELVGEGFVATTTKMYLLLPACFDRTIWVVVSKVFFMSELLSSAVCKFALSSLSAEDQICFDIVHGVFSNLIPISSIFPGC